MIDFDNPPNTRGLTERQIRNFFNKVNKIPGGCWLWTGAITSNGYGGVSINSKYIVAHKISYEYFVGLVPEGLVLDHVCRIRNCVNPSPDHLEHVTFQENILRGVGLTAINAKKTHCPKGHPYDVANTVYHVRGGRTCKTCIRFDSNGKLKPLKSDLKTHCLNGHPYDETNTYWLKRKDGSKKRQCKACKYLFNQRYNVNFQIAN
jgi:hypothetical protein